MQFKNYIRSLLSKLIELKMGKSGMSVYQNISHLAPFIIMIDLQMLFYHNFLQNAIDSVKFITSCNDNQRRHPARYPKGKTQNTQ